MDKVALDLGPIQIYWYSIFIFLGMLVACFAIYKEAKKREIEEEFLVNLTFNTIILGIIGARLYYVLFNLPYYLNNPIEILEIWNERVSAVRQIFKFVRTIVLVKSKDFTEYLIFEFDTVRYDDELYKFKWNKNSNLEGYDRVTGKHKFTWQPSGSQFTIIEEIPDDRLHIKIKRPKVLDKEIVLKALNFNDSWYEIIK